MDPGRAWPSEKECRNRAVPDRAPAMVDKNSNLDPVGRPEGDGSHQAPLGRFVKTYRRRRNRNYYLDGRLGPAEPAESYRQ